MQAGEGIILRIFSGLKKSFSMLKGSKGRVKWSTRVVIGMIFLVKSWTVACRFSFCQTF